MRIMILNGNPDKKNTGFDGYLNDLSSALNNLGHTTEIITLRNLSIHHCVGCYNCWLKTPGLCVFKDDMPELLSIYMKSDIVIFNSPVVMGFTSALIKKFQERLLPLIHPFLQVIGDRCQHIMRYDKYPVSILLLEKSADYDSVTEQILGKVFQSSKNRKFLFTKFMLDNPEEQANEINNI